MGKLTFIEPLKEYAYISSGYKPGAHPFTKQKDVMHYGKDYVAPVGREVLTSERGEV